MCRLHGNETHNLLALDTLSEQLYSGTNNKEENCTYKKDKSGTIQSLFVNVHNMYAIGKAFDIWEGFDLESYYEWPVGCIPIEKDDSEKLKDNLEYLKYLLTTYVLIFFRHDTSHREFFIFSKFDQTIFFFEKIVFYKKI